MSDRLAEIFAHKRTSSKQFREVQARHGLIPTTDVLVADPATREGTHELHKGIHWINLELSEFIGASQEEKPEELADVLHFIVELSILAGFDANEIIEDKEVTHYSGGDERIDRLDVMLVASVNDPFVFQDPITNARFTILAALQIAEQLKNKPWKQTLKAPPHPDDFKRAFCGLYYWFGATVRTTGLTPKDLFDQFVRKENINYERVATGV